MLRCSYLTGNFYFYNLLIDKASFLIVHVVFYYLTQVLWFLPCSKRTEVSVGQLQRQTFYNFPVKMANGIQVETVVLCGRA